jgi:hypothetical protein
MDGAELVEMLAMSSLFTMYMDMLLALLVPPIKHLCVRDLSSRAYVLA